MSLRLIKIPAWIFAVISGWLLIGIILDPLLSLLESRLGVTISADAPLFLRVILLSLLIPANNVWYGFINPYFFHERFGMMNFGVAIWSLVLLAIFSGSVYLIKKK